MVQGLVCLRGVGVVYRNSSCSETDGKEIASVAKSARSAFGKGYLGMQDSRSPHWCEDRPTTERLRLTLDALKISDPNGQSGGMRVKIAGGKSISAVANLADRRTRSVAQPRIRCISFPSGDLSAARALAYFSKCFATRIKRESSLVRDTCSIQENTLH